MHFQQSIITHLGRYLKFPRSDMAGVGVVAIASLAVTALLLGARQIGVTQPLELAAYDQMVRQRPQKQPDPRLLIVTITEADLRAYKPWPISDKILAQALRRLQSYSPKVIGLDLYRDLPQPPGNTDLKAQLQKPNLIGITFIGTPETGGTPPPPAVSQERIGFNDLVVDPDGIIRRNLMFASTDSSDLYSFSLRLALAYLATQGINPQPSSINSDYLQLGKAVFIPLEKNSGAYQSIDAAGYQVLLNYRSAGNVARQVTLSQLLNGQVDPSWVKDKIVLIGSTASSLKDLFYTPYSRDKGKNHKLPGVVVHAQMVSQILDAAKGERPLFSFWSEWQEVLWIAFWSVMGAILAWRIRRSLALGLSGVLMLGVLAGSYFYLFTQQLTWIPVATPAIAFIMSSGAVVAYRADQAQRQQKMVMKLLGQNTSPEIADALWSKRNLLLKSGKLPGQVLTATMLFADIKDFSSIAEQMLPEVLLEWLNELLEAITEEIQTHHGIVNKFTGDGLMAVFGVPVVRTHAAEMAKDAKAAVNCAMSIGDRLEKLNQGWLSRGLPAVQMRVGIATGSVVAGSLGGKNRLEYGVLGDSVNIASRLESFCKERQPSICRVLIAHSTLVYLKDEFQVEPWGPVALKGRRETVEVYRVVNRQSGKVLSPES